MRSRKRAGEASSAWLAEYKAWLTAPLGTHPPRFIEQLFAMHDASPRQGGRPLVVLIDGGGVRLASFAPAAILGMRQSPHLRVSTSASTFISAQLALATKPLDFALALKATATVPYQELLVSDPNSSSPFCSAAGLEVWSDRRLGGATVNDFLFDEKHPQPKGLEGYRHRNHVAVSVGFVHRKDVTRVTGGVALKPGESMEINFWNAVKANVLRFGDRSRMAQYLFPRDLFSHDPNNPEALGPLGNALRAVIDGDDANAAMKWLENEPQATWNCNSSRNPLAISAKAYCMSGGHLLVVADGQMLGPVPMVSPADRPQARIAALRTMPTDWWHAYENTVVQELDFRTDRTAALNFAAFSHDTAQEMSARGLMDAIQRQAELEAAFGFDTAEYLPEVSVTSALPLTARPEKRILEIIWKNLPGIAEAAPSAASVRESAWKFVLKMAGKGPDGVSRDVLESGLAMESGIA